MRLFLPCLLTVLLETPLFALAGYRSAYELTVVICTNVVTNLLLQLCFLVLPLTVLWTAFLELAVLAAECAVYYAAFGRRRGLFWLTLGANTFSLGVGLLLRLIL